MVSVWQLRVLNGKIKPEERGAHLWVLQAHNSKVVTSNLTFLDHFLVQIQRLGRLSDTETANLTLPFHQVWVASAHRGESNQWADCGGRTCIVAEIFPSTLNLNELRHAFVAVKKAIEAWQRGHTTASGRANSSSRCVLLQSIFVKVAGIFR